MADVPGDKGDPTIQSDVDTSPHPLVKKLLGDADPPRDLVELVGYFGPSKLPDSVRLYSSLDFRTYIEIPRGGIALTEPGDPADPDSPTKVFVSGAARLELVHVSSHSIEASFLRGEIESAHLRTAAGAGPAPEAQAEGREFATRHCFGGHAEPGPAPGPISFGVATNLFLSAPTRTHRPCCP